MPIFQHAEQHFYYFDNLNNKNNIIKPVILMVHGLGADHRDWAAQIAFLGEKYRIIAPDLRGFGQSRSLVLTGGIPQFAQDLLALLNHLNISNFDLMGHSMGGAISFELIKQLALNPNINANNNIKINKIIIINSQPSFKLDTPPKKLIVPLRRWVSWWSGMKGMGEYTAKKLMPNPDQPSAQQRMAQRYGQITRTAYLNTLKQIVNWHILPDLNQITNQILFILSDHDYTPVNEKESYIAQLKNASKHIITDSRHAVHLEKPDEVNAAIGTFLA